MAQIYFDSLDIDSLTRNDYVKVEVNAKKLFKARHEDWLTTVSELRTKTTGGVMSQSWKPNGKLMTGNYKKMKKALKKIRTVPERTKITIRSSSEKRRTTSQTPVQKTEDLKPFEPVSVLTVPTVTPEVRPQDPSFEHNGQYGVFIDNTTSPEFHIFDADMNEIGVRGGLAPNNGDPHVQWDVYAQEWVIVNMLPGLVGLTISRIQGSNPLTGTMLTTRISTLTWDFPTLGIYPNFYALSGNYTEYIDPITTPVQTNSTRSVTLVSKEWTGAESEMLPDRILNTSINPDTIYPGIGFYIGVPLHTVGAVPKDNEMYIMWLWDDEGLAGTHPGGIGSGDTVRIGTFGIPNDLNGDVTYKQTSIPCPDIDVVGQNNLTGFFRVPCPGNSMLDPQQFSNMNYPILRKIGSVYYSAMSFCGNIDPDTASGISNAGVKWAIMWVISKFNEDTENWEAFQSGVTSPATGENHFMVSMGMDEKGYSTLTFTIGGPTVEPYQAMCGKALHETVMSAPVTTLESDNPDVEASTETPPLWQENPGQNWWYCGNEAGLNTLGAGSYANTSIMYLDTEAFLAYGDFTVSAYWELENSDETQGWDTWNIRISSDGGATWELLTPENRPYDHLTSYATITSEGLPESSPLQPCYGKTSTGWEDLTCKLTGYLGQNVVVRIAFGSDPSVVAPGLYVRDMAHAGADLAVVPVEGESLPTQTRWGDYFQNCSPHQGTFYTSACRRKNGTLIQDESHVTKLVAYQPFDTTDLLSEIVGVNSMTPQSIHAVSATTVDISHAVNDIKNDPVPFVTGV